MGGFGSSDCKQRKLDTILKPVDYFPKDHPRARQLTKAITRMIAIDSQPYSVVDDRGFRELMSVAEPRYRLPSRTTFSRTLVPELYEQTKRSVTDKMVADLSVSGFSSDDPARPAPAPAFSFTTDIWTSRKMDAYISFTVSYLTIDFKLRALALENKPITGSHTADAILESLEKAMEEWKLPENTPVFCVRDNGSNLKSAVKKFCSWYDVSCFGHTLQLAIADAIKECDGMVTMLNKCRKIVSHYHHSCVAGGRIDELQRLKNETEYDFIMSCPTRWNSEFLMVQRLLILKESVCSDIAALGDIENLTTSEWKLADGFVVVLNPLFEATKVSSGEQYPTRSLVIPLLFSIYEIVNSFVSDVSNRGCGVVFGRKMMASLLRRFPNYKRALPDCLCTFLDPRFKSLLFDAETIDFIEQQLVEYGDDMLRTQQEQQVQQITSTTSAVTSGTFDGANLLPGGSAESASTSSGSGLWAFMDQLSQAKRSRDQQPAALSVNSIHNEVEQYIAESPVIRTSCPLEWWAENTKRFKTLSVLARGFLCIPATQTKSERLNSTSGNIVEDRRANLLTQHVRELTFLHDNLH
jgi:hypothetical protein